MKVRVMWGRFFMGILFGITETLYFGGNVHPKSSAELLADGLAMLMISLSMVPEFGDRL